MTNQVLLDASFWIALRDPRQPWHSQAREATLELLKQRTVFVFTSLVLAETHAYFARSVALRTQVLDDAQRNPALRWEPLVPGDEAAAVELLREHRDKSFSLCDAVSFVVMRRLELKRAAALDAHFRQIGKFEIIP